MPKTSIRGELLTRRKQLTADDRLNRSLMIQESLLATPEFGAADVLALYSPIHNEVYTDEIFKAARNSRKQVVYPRVRDNTLEFVSVSDLRELTRGAFGIAEPIGPVIPATALDLLIIPGVAFDREGFRLGYGKGFYDRALDGRHPGALVGLCFEFQVVANLPAEIHDIRMDILVTEKHIFRLGHAA